MEVSINQRGEVAVAVPAATPVSEIDAFLEQKAAWIRKRLDEHERSADAPPAHSYVTGDTFSLLGERLTLHVVDVDGTARPSARLERDGIVVRVPNGLDADQRRASVRRALERWYRLRAGKTLAERVGAYTAAVRAEPKAVRVRSQKTRWGSCGRDGTLRFNWCLVMAPLPLIDYIVVHELCHLRRAGHGRSFWNLVANVLPDYESRRAALRRDGWSFRLD